MVAAAPAAFADGLSEVRIVQVQLGSDGSFTEIGTPLTARSFSDGVAQTDMEFMSVSVAVTPGQTRSWDFAYTVSMRADGLPFPGGAPEPPACVPLSIPACAPPLDGQSLAWAFLTIGEIDGRSMPPFAEFSGGQRLEFELRDGSFEQSGLVHLEAGSSSAFSGWNGGFAVGAVTFAAAIPEPATVVQITLGLGLLAAAFARRRRLPQQPQHESLSAAPPPAA